MTTRERKLGQRVSTRLFRRQYRGLLTLAVLVLIPHAGVANAATLRVTTASDDSSPGSLRSVIASASPGDTIKFKQDLAGQTITLQPDLPLTIDKNVTIEGLGARRLTIAATHTNALVSSAVFEIANGAVVTMSGLRISGGRPGIHVGDTSTLNLSRSIVAGNVSQLVCGGITNDGTLTVDDTTISDNVGGDIAAGGICNRGTLFVHSSTISGNRNPGVGLAGGIGNGPNATLILINSTVGGNTSGNPGVGGIANLNDSTVLLINTTVSGNQSTLGVGAGIRAPTGGVQMINTILAGNTSGPLVNLIQFDCQGTITSLGNNLLGEPTGCDITLLPSDQTGDPRLREFTSNGAPGNGRFPLLPNSPAIDAANDAVCPKLDQVGRQRFGPCDIGSVERPER